MTDILRWFAVPPAAIAGATVLFFVGFTFLYLAGGAGDTIGGVDAVMFIQGLAGAGFVVAGRYTAPKHKKKTARWLTILSLIMACAFICGVLYLGVAHYVPYILYSIATVCGAIYAYMELDTFIRLEE